MYLKDNKMQETIKYSDINLDFVPHPLTGNLYPKTNIDSIRQAIKVLFLLNAYDIPFNESKMVYMESYLFQNITHLTIANLIKRIEWAIKTFEKRVEFISTQVVPLESDDGFDVTVTYKIKALNYVDTFSHVFQRTR